MPRYEVRLESQDSLRENGEPHFRLTRLVADDEAAARRHCERLELARVLYELPADQLAALDKLIDDHPTSSDPKTVLAAGDRGRYFTHHQEKPYLVVDVTEIKER